MIYVYAEGKERRIETYPRRRGSGLRHARLILGVFACGAAFFSVLWAIVVALA